MKPRKTSLSRGKACRLWDKTSLFSILVPEYVLKDRNCFSPGVDEEELSLRSSSRDLKGREEKAEGRILACKAHVNKALTFTSDTLFQAQSSLLSRSRQRLVERFIPLGPVLVPSDIPREKI